MVAAEEATGAMAGRENLVEEEGVAALVPEELTEGGQEGGKGEDSPDRA